MTDLIFSSVIIAAVAYLCGCFNGAVIVSKYIPVSYTHLTLPTIRLV